MRPVDFSRWPQLMTPGEVARVFRVDPKTVSRWESDGRIEAIRTPGNHRRFRREDIMALYSRKADA